MRFIFTLLLFVVFLLNSFFLQAQTTSPDFCYEQCSGPTLSHDKENPVKMDNRTLSIYLDNDAFSSKKDQDYTGGLAISFSGTNAKTHPFSIDAALTWINKSLNLEDENTALKTPLYSCEVGLNVFTPQKTTETNPIQNDRPYSSLVYLANGQQSLSLENRVAWVSSFTFGFLGTEIAANLQNSIHKVIGSSKAAGWDHQISEGGEPTFKYELSHMKFYPLKSYFHVVQTIRASVGFLTETGFGLSLRLGKIYSPWWTMDSSQNRLGSKTNPNMLTYESKNDFYLFLGSQLKVRLYNSFLQGQFRKSIVSYNYSETRPLVLETWIGLSTEFFNTCRLSYVYRFQTSELNTGIDDHNFTWGGVLLTYLY